MRTRWLIVVPLSLLVLPACPRRPSMSDPGPSSQSDPATMLAPAPRALPAVLPAGTTCGGRDDCASDQVCVRALCRYRATSAAAEILAAGAEAQVEAGELDGALRTYDQAVTAYRSAGAPVPPEVVCGAAIAALRAARTPDLRESAARRADTCFRSSLPGDPQREEVRTTLSRMRFDGLDAARFDRPEPADRFFALQPSRPTADAVAIAIDIPDRDNPGFAEVREALRADPAKRAIVDCFVQDWELRHQRQATASLVIRYQTTLRDMGDYDTFDPSLEIAPTTPAEDGFEPCLARALTATIAPGPRGHRIVAWQEPFEIAARLQ